MNFITMTSPVGPVLLVADGEHLVAALLEKKSSTARKEFGALEEKETPVLKKTRKQLEEYFVGQRTDFDIPLKPKGTEFQRGVWKALCKIPFGETRTYLQQAISLKNPKAVRAVGAANGKNPIWIIVPCHRVIGANGSLTGYAGGIDVKKYLLELESRQLRAPKLGSFPRT